MSGAISGAFGKSSSKSSSSSTRSLDVTETINRLSEEGRSTLNALISGLFDQTSAGTGGLAAAQKANEGLTREQAIADAQGGVQQIMTDAAQTIFPQLYSSQQGGGSYNNTTSQLLANDAMARAAAEGNALVTDTIAKYAEQSRANLETGNAQDAMAIEALLGALQLDAESTGTITREEDEKGTSKSKGSGSTASVGAKGSFSLI